MMQEPGRLIKRYLVDDISIFWLTLKQKLGLYKNPWDTNN
jgi:UDP-N-acetyl-D-mannosaminuronic acid transferase (WecB/TagA/CpsF family)